MWRDLSDGAKVIAVTFILGIMIIGAVLGWVTIFGPLFQDQQREQFQRSQTHMGAVAQDLTDRCADLATTTDPVARKALVVVIAQRASGENVQGMNLAPSVLACVRTAEDQYINGGK